MSGADLFDKVRMGYVVIESQRREAWRSFLEGGFGMHCDAQSDGSLSFRIDEHACRIRVVHGPAEDVIGLGYELADEAALSEVEERLAAHGITHRELALGEATLLGVRRALRFTGPKCLVIDAFVHPAKSVAPLDMKTSAFVTGRGGMGHIALTSRRPKDMRRFWTEIFDARYSDTIIERIAGVTLDIEFFRLNGRHHSVAVATPRLAALDPVRTRVQHVNVEVATLDDLIGAFLRCRALGFEMAHEIGQHPNDLELSFYALSPSGFEFECGWRAVPVDEATWSPKVHDGISLWGHRPEHTGAVHQLGVNAGNFGRAATSLLKPEFSPLTGAKP